MNLKIAASRRGRLNLGALALLGLLWAATLPSLAQETGEQPAVASPPASQVSRSESLETTPIPVKFRGRVLFSVSSGTGDLDTAQRAAAIEERMLRVASQPSTLLNSLRVVEEAGSSSIYAGDALIRLVTDADAAGSTRSRAGLANEYLHVIRTALTEEYRDRTASALWRSAALAVAATVIVMLLLFGLTRLYALLGVRLATAARRWHEDSRWEHVRLLSPLTLVRVSRHLATTLSWLIGFLLVFAYLEFVLSLFPWTRGIARTMLDATGEALVRLGKGVVGYLPNLLSIIVFVLFARLVLRLLRAFFDQVHAQRVRLPGFYPEWALPTYSLLRFLVIIVAAVMIFPYLPGAGSDGFKGISVFLGLLLSLGSASAIANVVAGTVLTYMRPFQTGDRVKIADAVGDVIDRNLLVVRLRTIKNVDITVPNALVLSNHIINYSSSAQTRGLILHTQVTIGYSVPWQQVHELLIAAATRTEGIQQSPAPFVLQTSLDDNYVAYEINAYTGQPNDMAQIYSRLHASIQDSFAKAGVEIMSPHYTAVRDGNAVTLPDDHLPKDYQAPPFNVLSRVLRERPKS